MLIKEREAITEVLWNIRQENFINLTTLDDETIEQIKSFERNVGSFVKMQRTEIINGIMASVDKPSELTQPQLCSLSFLNSDGFKLILNSTVDDYVKVLKDFVNALATLQVQLRTNNIKNFSLVNLLDSFWTVDARDSKEAVLEDILIGLKAISYKQQSIDWAAEKISAFIDTLLDIEHFRGDLLQPLTTEINNIISSFSRVGSCSIEKSHAENEANVKVQRTRFANKADELLDSAKVNFHKMISTEADKLIKDLRESPQSTTLRMSTTLSTTEVTALASSTLLTTSHVPAALVSEKSMDNVTRNNSMSATIRFPSQSYNNTRNSSLPYNNLAKSSDSRLGVALLGILLPLVVALLGLLLWRHKKPKKTPCFFNKKASREAAQSSYIPYSSVDLNVESDIELNNCVEKDSGDSKICR